MTIKDKNNLVSMVTALTFMILFASAMLFSDGSEDVDGDDLDLTQDGIEYTIFENDTFATVTGYERGIVDVVIPSKVMMNSVSYDVTSISDSAFYDCSSLRSISMKNVVDIGVYAFDACASLETAVFDNVASIGDGTFYDCTSLRSITLGKDSELDAISNFAFYNCGKLVSINIPDSVTVIGASAFEGCGSLSSISMNNVESLYVDAFSGCSSLVSVTMPDDLSLIGYNVFRDCTSLQTITIPEKVTALFGNTFRGCSSLTSITMPDSVVSIGGNAFRDCVSLRAFSIPDNIVNISFSTFRGCTSLSEITMPDSVVSIGENAFFDCTSLRSITMPGGMEAVGKNAFSGCIGLGTMTISGHGKNDVNILNAYFSTDVWSIGGSGNITELIIDTFDEIDIDNVTVIDGNILTITLGSGNVIGADEKLLFEGEPVTGMERSGKKYVGSEGQWNGTALPDTDGSLNINMMILIIVVIAIVSIVFLVMRYKQDDM